MATLQKGGVVRLYEVDEEALRQGAADWQSMFGGGERAPLVLEARSRPTPTLISEPQHEVLD